MADTESILRLGIEAARSGDKDEARNMFRLLTRQDSDNPQAWLWLAGVAADNDEKRAALERVLELDPHNEMAAVGLQALGGASAKKAPPPEPEPLETQPFTMDSFDDFDFGDSTPAPAPAPAAPARSSAPSTPSYDDPDLDFASSLDSIGMYENYAAKAESGGSSSSSRSTSSADNYSIPDFGDDDDEMDLAAYMNRPRVSAADIELEEEEEAPARRKLPIIPIIALVALAGLIAFLVLQFLNDDPPPTTGSRTPQATSAAGGNTAEPGTNPTADPNASGLPTLDPNVAQPTVDPNVPQPTFDPNLPQPTVGPGTNVQPTAPPFNPGGLAGANPSAVPPGTTLEAGDWVYNFPTSQYAGLLSPAQVGGNEPAPNGRWLLVLMIVNNASGQEQQLPADAFVIKDAQGGIYLPDRGASEIYLNQAGRGLAADFSHNDALPVGIDVSVPLIYQVGIGATDLTLFSPQNPNEGYVVVQQVR